MNPVRRAASICVLPSTVVAEQVWPLYKNMALILTLTLFRKLDSMSNFKVLL